jgi:hypothetical protein
MATEESGEPLPEPESRARARSREHHERLRLSLAVCRSRKRSWLERFPVSRRLDLSWRASAFQAPIAVPENGRNVSQLQHRLRQPAGMESTTRCGEFLAGAANGLNAI